MGRPHLLGARRSDGLSLPQRRQAVKQSKSVGEAVPRLHWESLQTRCVFVDIDHDLLECR